MPTRLGKVYHTRTRLYLRAGEVVFHNTILALSAEAAKKRAIDEAKAFSVRRGVETPDLRETIVTERA